MRYVIAVAAGIGAGKTSLVKAIADRLTDATTFHYDSYEKATEMPVQAMVRWMRDGADADSLLIPNLAEDLEKLKRGETVVDPSTNREIRPGKYIIFEMPLGKEHRKTAAHIDLLIWVETPLDVALARKIKEFTSTFLTGHERKDHRAFIVWLDRYLDHYLEFTRQILKIQKERVSPTADIILDGQCDLETLAQRATEAILLRIP